jgi:hypothetical protein
MRRSFLALLSAVILLPVGATGVSAAPPNNDEFGDARVVGALPYTNTVDTSDATRSEPDQDCFGGEVHTVWYRFTASATAPTLVEVDAAFDATLSVFTGTGDALEGIDCADDPPSLVLDARSGTTYHIMVASCCDEPGGSATLRLSELRAPRLDVRLGGGTADTRTGDGSARGGVTCQGVRRTTISVQVRQRTRTGRIVTGYGETSARCVGAARRWNALVLSDRALRPGWARVMVWARACGGGVCVTDRVNRIIWLSRRPLT